MRIIFDIGHPGHVHLFKHLAQLLQKDGAEVLFTARDKEFEIELLRAEGFRFKNFGKHYKSLWGKLWGLLKFDFQMLFAGLQFKPDLFVSHGSIYAAHAAFALGKKHLSLEDSGNMEQIVIYRPFTDKILTPDVLPENLGPKQIRYEGYHEIAYLHPDFFRPNPQVYGWLGLNKGEKYAIVRFVSWNATHDAGHSGLSNEDKIKLVRKLSKHMKVFISSEKELSQELKQYQIKIAPEKLHHALAFAEIVVSEGATIASEAGVLGTPTIYINTIARSYCQDQERYGTVFNTSDSAKVFALVDEILKENREVFRQRSRQLLADKVNVTQFLYDFIQKNYAKAEAEKSFAPVFPTDKSVG
jgi:predicted glycosyltransferase